jgi:hypothetical protein
MNDTAAMSLLAHSLVDPKLLLALERGSKAHLRRKLTADHYDAAVVLDRKRLALFAGFITMVRHNNDLFAHLPGTLRVLRYHQAELSVFRDHFLSVGRPPKLASNKIRAALASLRDIADSRRGRSLTGFKDVLLHEQCKWEILEDMPAVPGAVTPGSAAFSTNAVPFFTGPARAVHLIREPDAVLAAISSGGSPRSIRKCPQWLLYVGDARKRTLRILRITRLAAETVRAIDGTASCAEILARLTQARPVRTGAVRGTFEALCAAQVIRYSPEAIS